MPRFPINYVTIASGQQRACAVRLLRIDFGSTDVFSSEQIDGIFANMSEYKGSFVIGFRFVYFLLTYTAVINTIPCQYNSVYFVKKTNVVIISVTCYCCS